MNENESMLARGARLGVVLFALLLALAALLMALAPPAQARTLINERLPISDAAYSCNGELFTYEGTIHIMATQSEDKTGGSHFKNHFNVQAHGETPSGAKYIISSVNDGMVQFIENESTDNGPLTATATEHMNVLRQGEDGTEDDYKARGVFHITQNANGELTAYVGDFEFECQ
jgi:hypothetical protein